MNPFESGARKLIPAVLIYVRHQGRILMIHRNSNLNDYHLNKWNGLGGKLEADESPLQAAKRELKEESGLDLPEDQFQARGVIQFPLFKPRKQEDWMVFLFTASCSDQEQKQELPQCPEGTLHWVPSEDVEALNLWPGDRLFLPQILKGQTVIGTIWYAPRGEVDRHWLHSLL